MASQAQRPIENQSSVSKGGERGSIVPGDSPLTRDNGIVFRARDTVSVRQYLISLVNQISNAQVLSASRISNGRIAAYLSSREAVVEAVQNGLTYDGSYIELTPLVQPTTRLTLSNVYPEIPNTVLIHNLSSFCKVVSQVRSIPLGFKEKHLSHIMSFRRQVHVLLKPNVTPPEHINFSYLGTNYRVFLSTESVRCFSCGEYGHISRACKKQGTDDTYSNETNPLNPPPTFVHNPSNRNKSDPKHPPKVSKKPVPLDPVGDADRPGSSGVRTSAGDGGPSGPVGAACARPGHAAGPCEGTGTGGSAGAGGSAGSVGPSFPAAFSGVRGPCVVRSPGVICNPFLPLPLPPHPYPLPPLPSPFPTSTPPSTYPHPIQTRLLCLGITTTTVQTFFGCCIQEEILPSSPL